MMFFVCIVSSINRGIMSITILAMTQPLSNSTVDVPDVNIETREFFIWTYSLLKFFSQILSMVPDMNGQPTIKVS